MRRPLLALLLLTACGRRVVPAPSPDAPAAHAASAAPAAPTASAAAASASAAPTAPAASAAGAAPAASEAAPAPAASEAPARNPSVKAKAAALAERPPRPLDDASAGFVGPVRPERDGVWLRRLVGDEIASAVFHGGGTSVTIQLRFADGARALFKPHQTTTSSNFRAEIAAYHLDRLLGLGRVAPVAGRPLSLRWLRQQLASDEAALGRLDREVLAEGDRVQGALIAWHERAPTPAEPPPGWQRLLEPGAPLAADDRERALAWSDLVLFDALIDNTDRWSGGNVLTLGPGGALIFLDNASAFLPYRARQHAFLERPLTGLCRFRRATVEALRAGAPDAPPERRLSSRLAASLARDPTAPVLSPSLLSSFDERLARALRHVEGCVDRHGSDEALR